MPRNHDVRAIREGISSYIMRDPMRKRMTHPEADEIRARPVSILKPIRDLSATRTFYHGSK